MLRKIREKLAGKTAKSDAYEALPRISKKDAMSDGQVIASIKENMGVIADKLGAKTGQQIDNAIHGYKDLELQSDISGYFREVAESGTKRKATQTMKKLSDSKVRSYIDQMGASASTIQDLGYLSENLTLPELRKAVLAISEYSDNPTAVFAVSKYISGTLNNTNKKERNRVIKTLGDPGNVAEILREVDKSPGLYQGHKRTGPRPDSVVDIVAKYVEK